MITKIIESIALQKDFIEIQKFDFENDKENELLLFFKPEVFFSDKEYSDKIIEMTFEKLANCNVKISGIAMLSGDFIKQHEIMDRHYGFINKISKNASTIITSEETEKIKTLLEIENINDYKILGGHEFLNYFKNQTLETLGQFWFSKPCVKIRSGFYAISCEVEGQNIILVNGFHPSQLAHFQNKNHKIVVALVHTNTDWNILKNEMIGNTFPEKAIPNSVRGELFINRTKYGAMQVSANYNFVHLSAGPFEALFEINNFLSHFPNEHFDLEATSVAQKIIQKNLIIETIQKIISNPIIDINGKNTDLFTYTEEMNTTQAINSFQKFYC